ncbi:MAG TPA: YjgN family protein [Polaromonas sp.]|uniref:YjgN family protein n=1 Tax=Polaromonas sp. TaxID=1869339 RepID=UPI002D37DA24|nr:YjgN family protein [Polaromonas sp.]HYW58775.1 YjgN family protein [Polaromonas sp.]
MTDSVAHDHRGHHLRVEFTGSGSEYFRIWIVNLLLLLVTLGIYFPWAKVRRLRYFYGNTLVDGEPLGFHGDPKKMLKGYFLVGVLFTLYSAAGKFSATAGFVAFLILVAIWPALLKSSMQFRLANTSWRGLRFGFRGSLGDAYRAVVPMFLPGLVILGAVIGVVDPDKPPNWYVYTVLAVMGVSMAVAPWLLWSLKQYQHNHYALASLQTTFKATVGSFYKVFFKTFGVMLVAATLTAALLVGTFFAVKSGGLSGKAVGFAMIAGLLGSLAAVLAMLVVVKPYVVSRMQNLVWTRTGNASLRFRSELGFRAMLWLTIKNWLLVIVTLGFYWPFAAVAMARLRLEAVTVKTRVSPDTLVTQVKAVEGDAAGEAAGDLFGLDIGF